MNNNIPKDTDDGWIDIKILNEFIQKKAKERPSIVNKPIKDIMTMPEFLEYVKQRQTSDNPNNKE